MVRLKSKFKFEAAHRLFLYNGDCNNIHGHSYKVEIGLKSEISSDHTVQKDLFTEQEEVNYPGISVDFKWLKMAIGGWIRTKYDHALLLNIKDPLCNATAEYTSKIVSFLTNPTAEIIAIKLFKEIVYILSKKSINAQLEYVNVWETEDSCAVATDESIINDI